MQMTKDELERILHSLCSNLGLEEHSQKAMGEFLKQVNTHVDTDGIRAPYTLRRLERTVAGVKEKFPRLKPVKEKFPRLKPYILFHYPQIIFHYPQIRALTGNRRAELSLGLVQSAIHDLDTRRIPLCDSCERYLRALISGREEKGENWYRKLGISGFMPSEKCLGGCRSCAISARAGGPQMPWEIFEGAIESEDIFISRNSEIWLGGGEPIIYPHLFEMVEKLIVECGCRVAFTTAGLLPQNRRWGSEFFNRLQSLGVYGSDLEIRLSFNLQFRQIRTPGDVDAYVGCVEETLDAIAKSGAQFKRLLGLAPKDDKLGTRDAYLKVMERMEESYGFSHGSFHRGILNIGDAYDSGIGTETEDSQGCNYTPGKYALRPDGSLTTGCCGFGRKGSSIGNLCENSHGQMRQMARMHDMKFSMDILNGPNGKCFLHQRWKNGRFRAPKSNNPVIKLKRAIGAGGMRQGGRKICRK